MLAHYKIICDIVENSYYSLGKPFTSFLELGCNDGGGVSFHIKVDKVVAVDKLPISKLPANVQFIQSTTDTFFNSCVDTFDAIFIDADHKASQVMRDFDNSLKILNPGGIIFLHDTDPINKEHTRRGLCNDSYVAYNQIGNRYKGLHMINLPVTVTGLAIVQVFDNTRVNKWLP